MSILDVDKLVRELNNSKESQLQIGALERICHLNDVFLEVAIRSLKNTDSQNKLFVAEQIFEMGHSFVKHIENVFQTPLTEEEKVLYSMIALSVGSHVGVPTLLSTIVADSEYSCLAARKLAEAGVAAAADKITERLNSIEEDKIDEINCLLLALQKLKILLPEN